MQIFNNYLVFNWYLKSGQKLSTIQILSKKQTIFTGIQIPSNVYYSSHYMNDGPFDHRSNLYDLNSRQVRYSDPHCILLQEIIELTFTRQCLRLFHLAKDIHVTSK